MPNYLATTDLMRTEGNLSSDIKTELLEVQIKKASTKVKKLIGPDKYAELLPKINSDEAADLVAIAEANYALYYAIPKININATSTGITRSTGFNESRQELIGQFEATKLAETFKKTALEILSPFIINQDEDEITSVRTNKFNLSVI